jgi:SAM-dependent methyltransferase
VSEKLNDYDQPSCRDAVVRAAPLNGSFEKAMSPFGLPSSYIERSESVYFDDSPYAETEIVHQPEVYSAAEYFLKAMGRTAVIDIGCGNGRKLRQVKAVRHIGVDFGPNIAWCRDHYGRWGEWFEVDLSQESCVAVADLADATTVVVCADVIEHLVDLLAACYARNAIVITSTPDRIRVRGADHHGPPSNPHHVREWALEEYAAFLRERGLPAVYSGYTLNNNLQRELKTIVTVHDASIDRARSLKPSESRPIAIIAAYNECDVIEEVIDDLLAQGCEVVAIDNWSTDGTWEILQTLSGRYPSIIRLERFPASGATVHYEWHPILLRKAEIASEFPGRWIIHTDADELRRSPFPDLTVARALTIAEQTGANRVSFQLINFRPVDDRPYRRGSLSSHFSYFEYGTRPGHFRQSKAWLQGVNRIDLASTGGHAATFPDARDFPYKFLLRHYPIRSRAHGWQKVMVDRRPRWSPYERDQLGWHVQYDGFESRSDFNWSARDLYTYNDVFWQEHGLLVLTDLKERRLDEGLR